MKRPQVLDSNGNWVVDGPVTVGDYAGAEANQNRLTKTINKMMNGDVVKIVCYGDSITYGQTSAGPRSANPYPSVLQARLRKIYANNNITVVNNGNPGQTSDWLLANIGTVLNESPDMCVVMCGINDANPTLSTNTQDIYKNNLLKMISTLNDKGIEVLIMSPTPIIKPDNSRNLRLLTYVRAAQEAAKLNNTAFIDIYSEIIKIFKARQEAPFTMLGDQVHWIEGKYGYIADVIARELDYHNSGNSLIINDTREVHIAVADSPYVDYDISGANLAVNALQFQTKNVILQGDAVNGTFLRFSFYAEQPGMDLVILGARTVAGGIATFTDNGVDITPAVDFNSSVNALYETEMTLIENIPIGFHTIELLNTKIALGASATTGKAYISEFIFRKGSKPINGRTDRHYKLSGTLTGSTEKFRKVMPENGTIRYKSVAGNAMGVLFMEGERAEIESGKKLVVEAEGKFAALTGLSIFANPSSANAGVANHTGYTFYMTATAYSLCLGTATTIGDGAALATFATTPDFNIAHKIRIEVTDAGVITVFVDGVQVLTATNTKEKGGAFGLFANNVAATVELTRLEFAYV